MDYELNVFKWVCVCVLCGSKPNWKSDDWRQVQCATPNKTIATENHMENGNDENKNFVGFHHQWQLSDGNFAKHQQFPYVFGLKHHH